MIKDLKIYVSSLENKIPNGNFELWNLDTPDNWEIYYPTGNTNSVAPYSYADGYAVSLNDMVSGSNSVFLIRPFNYLTSGLEDGKTYQVRFRARGHGYVKSYSSFGTGVPLIDNGDGNIEINSSDWQTYTTEFVFVDSYVDMYICLIQKYNEDENFFYVDDISMVDPEWYNNREQLDETEIEPSSLSDLYQEIEDDIFTFKSDSISFNIRNYGEKTNRFNPQELVDNGSRIFRFDYEITYDNDTTRNITLFSNNDTIERNRRRAYDYMEVSTYELATLFKDNGWYLGRIKYEEDNDGVETEVYFEYTSRNTSNGEYASRVPIATVLSTLEDDIYNLCRTKAIPVRSGEVTISNQIQYRDKYINLPYNTIINTQYNKLAISDMVKSPSGRIFFLMSENVYSMQKRLNIYELVNGSTIINTGIYAYIGTGVSEITHTVNFIHTYEDTTYDNGQDIEFAIIATGIRPQIGVALTTAEQIIGIPKITEFTNNDSSGEDTDNDLVLVRTFNMGSGDAQYLIRTRCGYYDDDGIFVVPDSYTNETDNAFYLQNSATIEDGDFIYTVSQEIEYETEFGVDITQSIAEIAGLGFFSYRKYYTFNAYINMFPQYYSFRLKDKYVSDILKEISITQDSVWYSSYDDGIEITLQSRDFGFDSVTTLADSNWMESTEKIKKVTFDNLDSELFKKDETRLRSLLNYYYFVYGGGRSDLQITEWDYENYTLGDVLWKEPNYYLVKGFGWGNNDRKTYLRLFEVRYESNAD